MENLNLVELLKDAPIGTRLYSPICGECELTEVRDVDSDDAIKVRTRADYTWNFDKNGHFVKKRGECLLFPSKNNKDWSTFKVEKEGLKVGDHVKHKKTGEVYFLTGKSQNKEGLWAKRINYSFGDCELYISEHSLGEYEKVSKFDPKWLKPFDRVLVKDKNGIWAINLFSYCRKDRYYPFSVIGNVAYQYCIPFNEETKHLVGTTGEEPNFYEID